MASLITVRINKGDSPNLGFRLQGGKDFGTPLVVQKVNGGSPAERAGLIAGDSVIKINNIDVFNLRHKDAQDVVVRAGGNFEITVQRGGSTWRPTVIPTGTYSTPTPHINSISPVTRTSLAATKGDNWDKVGTGHNVSAKPFGAQVNGAVNGGPKVVNKQYNSPIKLYSDESIAETLIAQTEVLPTGALGVNFKKNEKNYDASNSAVLRALKETENEPRTHDEVIRSELKPTRKSPTVVGRHSPANSGINEPRSEEGATICTECERVIVGVFVRIKDKNLHVECFKCSTCGSSLKNVGYYNINNKLYCDIHAKSAALRNNPNPNLVPVTIPPGGKAPAHAISSALSTHSLPSPSPLSPNSYSSPYQQQESKSVDVISSSSNNSSSVYCNATPVSFDKYLNKGSNISGPKPFSSVSAPLSPHNTLPRAPLSPVAQAPVPSYNTSSYSPVSSAGKSTSSIVWPPPQETSELPTACPLFYPPPSRVEEKFAKSFDLESECTADCSELEDINMASFYEQKTSSECVEMIQESLETHRFVQQVLEESQTPKASCPLELPKEECCKKKEICAKKTENPKFGNPVPLKWESPLTQAIRTTAPDSDTFSLIPPTKHSSTPLASALLTAPSEPFTPKLSQNEEPVPLPEETEPYFPPERPVLPPKEEGDKTAKTVKKKGKDPYEEYFKDLEQPATKLSMLEALTVAPDRSYSPLIVESVEIEKKEAKDERKIDKSNLQKVKKPEVLPESFKITQKLPLPPSYYSPSVLYEKTEEIKSAESTEETNTSTTKTIEKQTIQNETTDANAQMHPPVFKGFTCSFDHKCEHSKFSVEISTEPPIITGKPVEQKSSVIEKEVITEEKKAKQQKKEIKGESKETIKQPEEVIVIKPTPQVSLHKIESIPQYQVQLMQEAEANLMMMEKREKAQVRLEQQRQIRQPQAPTPTPIIRIEEEKPESRKPAQEHVQELRPPSRTFSPRPGSITPSMINKAPAILPYYQANLVPQQMGAVAGNIFDPKSPAVSRSPSPCPGARQERSASPFPGSREGARSVSPAPGPPPNPLQSTKPLPKPGDSKIVQARENLTTFIPEYKEKMEKSPMIYSSTVQTQNYPNYQLQAGKKVCEIEARAVEVQQAQRSQQLQEINQNVVKSTKIDEMTRQAHLEQMKKSQSESVEKSADGRTQIQRKKTVTEEYERSQKETNIQIETNVTKYPFQNVNVPRDPTPAISHVTAPKKISATSCASAASACVSPQKCSNPTKSQSHSGVGTGKQAGGVSVAPRRGRGVLNPANLAGSRIPLCGSCNMQIRGPFITALGKIWCPNHFICATPSCRRPLQDIGFVEERGQLYCEYCFEQYLAPSCSKCGAKIKGDCLKAIGKNFHPECFNCTYCGKLFGNSPFFLEDGSPYCETDWNELFTTKCFACGFPVEAGDRWVEALNNNYHSQCFNCTMCKKNLEGQSFFAKGGRPYCKNHAR